MHDSSYTELSEDIAVRTREVEKLRTLLDDAEAALKEKRIERASYAPVNHIPVDVLKMILEAGHIEAHPSSEEDWSFTFRNTFSLVSSRFRMAAVQTPFVWSNIYLHFGARDQGECTRTPMEYLLICIRRSCDYPLQVFFEIWCRRWDCQCHFIPIVMSLRQEFRRSRTFRVVVHGEGTVGNLRDMTGSLLDELYLDCDEYKPPSDGTRPFALRAPRVSRLKVFPDLPSRSSIPGPPTLQDMTSLILTESSEVICYRRIHQNLRITGSLSALDLAYSCVVREIFASNQTISLPSLRSLKIEGDGNVFIHLIDAPSLATLYVTHPSVPLAQIVDRIGEAGNFPALRSFHVSECDGSSEILDPGRFMQSTPLLERLDLSWYDTYPPPFANSLLQNLLGPLRHGNGSVPWPKLRCLTLPESFTGLEDFLVSRAEAGNPLIELRLQNAMFVGDGSGKDMVEWVQRLRAPRSSRSPKAVVYDYNFSHKSKISNHASRERGGCKCDGTRQTRAVTCVTVLSVQPSNHTTSSSPPIEPNKDYLGSEGASDIRAPEGIHWQSIRCDSSESLEISQLHARTMETTGRDQDALKSLLRRQLYAKLCEEVVVRECEVEKLRALLRDAEAILNTRHVERAPHAPVYRLPVEVLSRILEAGCAKLCSDRDEDWTLDFRSSFSMVSRRFRDVCYQTSIVWSSIYLHFGTRSHGRGTPSLAPYLRNLLARSGNRVLRIVLRSSCRCQQCITEMEITGSALSGVTQRLRSLRVMVHDRGSSKILAGFGGMAGPMLERLRIEISEECGLRDLELAPIFSGGVPRLAKVKITPNLLDRSSIKFALPILQGIDKLVILEFLGLFYSVYCSQLGMLTSLTRLDLTHCSIFPDTMPWCHVSLPSLRSMSVGRAGDIAVYLIAAPSLTSFFVNHPEAPLKKIIYRIVEANRFPALQFLEVLHHQWLSEESELCLQFVQSTPLLEGMTLCGSQDSSLVKDIFQTLQVSSDLWPKLWLLRISGFFHGLEHFITSRAELGSPILDLRTICGGYFRGVNTTEMVEWVIEIFIFGRLLLLGYWGSSEATCTIRGHPSSFKIPSHQNSTPISSV
ncbi:hypothetical protein JAAARDRAFT_690956 [Jaapia argillacea MUCL 33604]|uniref:Uncharacterized protein n=1 Tax=Jaapia argillacea MUCL 33604 TaxID=933084 RepID=A0A067PMK3_9AGAM|nr:hypothetical protein JAAARDRAFT_690956 [Jaapia argillacea MUCL 33604]